MSYASQEAQLEDGIEKRREARDAQKGRAEKEPARPGDLPAQVAVGAWGLTANRTLT